MTPTPAITIDPRKFAKDWGRVSFPRVGIAMLITAHLALAPRHTMSRPGLHAALRANTPYAIDAVDSVIDAYYAVDADGLIFSPRRGSE